MQQFIYNINIYELIFYADITKFIKRTSFIFHFIKTLNFKFNYKLFKKIKGKF